MKKILLGLSLIAIALFASCQKDKTSEGNAVFGFDEVAETVVESLTTLSVPIVVAAETAPTEWPITFDIALTVAEGGSKDGVTITKATDLTITEANNTFMELTLTLNNETFEENRVYTFTIENLRGKGVTLDDAKKSFVLTVTNDDAKEVPTIPIITANCFIVAPSGEVTVPINNVNVFWNKGGDGAITTEMGETWSEPNLEAPAVLENLISDNTYVAEVIWSDIAEGVNVTFAKTKGNFTVLGIPATPGNIVVGVKKAQEDTDYLWSWHLWVTDYDPNLEASSMALPSGVVAMDRNLGATNATIADVGALGLLYQWGRKDPFPGASSINEDIVRTVYPAMPVAVTNGAGTLLKVVENPNIFYATNNFDGVINIGHLSGDKGFNRWGGATSHTDITPIKSAKSIYDPCPEGWRMPWGENWSGFIKGGNFDTDLKRHLDDFTTYPGRTYSKDGKTVWFPASGWYRFNNGILVDVSNRGFVWSASPYDTTSGCSLLFENGQVNSSNFSFRSNGFTVRPVKDPDYVPAQ